MRPDLFVISVSAALWPSRLPYHLLIQKRLISCGGNSCFCTTVFCKIKIECYNWCHWTGNLCKAFCTCVTIPGSKDLYLPQSASVPHKCPRASEPGFRSPNFTVKTRTGPLRLGVRGKQATFQQSLDVTCDQECDPSK